MEDNKFKFEMSLNFVPKKLKFIKKDLKIPIINVWRMALKNSTSSFDYASSDYSYIDEEDDAYEVDEMEFYE